MNEWGTGSMAALYTVSLIGSLSWGSESTEQEERAADTPNSFSQSALNHHRENRAMAAGNEKGFESGFERPRRARRSKKRFV